MGTPCGTETTHRFCKTPCAPRIKLRVAKAVEYPNASFFRTVCNFPCMLQSASTSQVAEILIASPSNPTPKARRACSALQGSHLSVPLELVCSRLLLASLISRVDRTKPKCLAGNSGRWLQACHIPRRQGKALPGKAVGMQRGPGASQNPISDNSAGRSHLVPLLAPHPRSPGHCCAAGRLHRLRQPQRLKPPAGLNSITEGGITPLVCALSVGNVSKAGSVPAHIPAKEPLPPHIPQGGCQNMRKPWQNAGMR